MADFPVDAAQLVALFMESMFFGLYLVTFGMCLYVLLIKSRSRTLTRERIVFLLVTLALFTIATFDVALLLRHVLDAFVWYHGPGGAAGEFHDISYWVNVMKTVTYNAQTSIADGMLIYRCFIIYGRRWLVISPLCLIWAAGIATSIVECYIDFTLHTSALLNTSKLTPFITSVVVSTLVLNLIATTMIVHKIWKTERQTRKLVGGMLSDDNALKRATRIIVESGLMYTLSVVCFFAVYLAGNNAQYGVSDCVVQVIGISFNLIIIRVDQGKTIETMHRMLPVSAPMGSMRRSLDTLRIRPLAHTESRLSTGDVSISDGRVFVESDIRMVEVKSDDSHSRVHVVSVPTYTPNNGGPEL